MTTAGPWMVGEFKHWAGDVMYAKILSVDLNAIEKAEGR